MKGFIVIISAPSGTGKTTIAKSISSLPDFVKSVSATTRPPRPGEIEGQDYFFVTKEKFKEMLDSGDLLESNLYVGNYYGTPKAHIVKSIQEGKNVLLTIETSGLHSIKKILPEQDIISIFVTPPSLKELEKRLTNRGESPEVISSRMNNAKAELANAHSYDYIVVNDKLDQCITTIEHIMEAEQHRSSRSIAEL